MANKKTFKSPSELADFLKETLRNNEDLLKSHALENVADAIDELYSDEADANYDDSYEESY